MSTSSRNTRDESSAVARLRAFRAEKHLTQKQAAEMAGMSVSQYGKLERGQLHGAALRRVARAFGVEPAERSSADAR